MKKTYNVPEVKAIHLKTRSMLALSYGINDTTVNGDQAITKQDNGWDIWGGDDEAE